VTRPAIRLRIGRDGRVQAETVGMTGESCLDVVPLVEDLVAAQVVASRYLPEFFAAAGADAASAEVTEQGADTEQVRYVTDREPE
jgi:hypothetical protein